MNETNVKVSFNNSVTNAKKLDTYAEKLKEIYGILSAIDKGQLAQLGDFNITLTKVKDNTQNLDKNTSKFAKNMNTAFNIGKMALFSKKIYGLGRGIAELTTKSSSYVENLNLLEVAYANIDRKTGEFNEDIKVTSGRIEKLINNMSEVYGLDESDLARTFGIFKQLANAMELPTQTAENLSELMVKMRQDIASLYNLDLDRAGNALQSALAGQVRPIRTATGADITEKTLQKTVDSLGLDTTISKLSFVEKRLIMVISLTNQLRNSQGDYGRTIESIANQTKVLHDQWERLTRAIGNVFNPLIKSILPVVNGVLMALTEIANIIASLLGFKLDEFDYSGLAGVSDYANDIIDGFDGAGASVDKLKKKLGGLRSFDKLNVISTPSDSGKSSGGGNSGGINSKILEAFNSAFSDYDDMLGKVKMKANDIRDSIMDWLGFTKQINPLTGEVSWKYDGIKKTLKNVWESFKKLNPLAKIFTGLAVWKVFQQMWTWGGKLLNLLGVGGLAKSISNVMKDMGNISNDLPTISSNMDRFKTAVAGVALAFLGKEGLVSAMKSFCEEGPNVQNVLGGITSAFSMIAGFTMIGSAFGPIGAGIGFVTGAVATLITAIESTEDEYDVLINKTRESLKPIEDFADEVEKQFQSVDESIKKGLLQTDISQGLVNELKEITDENGRVKAGYEERANFIITELNSAYGLEIKMVDGVIEKYDEQIKKIQAVIDKKRLEFIEEKAREKYNIALENQNKALAELAPLQKKWNDLEDEANRYAKLMYKAMDEGNDELVEMYANLNATARAEQYGMKPALEKAQKAYEDTQEVILAYNGVIKGVTASNIDEAQYYLNKLMDEHEQEQGIFKQKMLEAQQQYKTRKDLIDKEGREATEAEKYWFEEGYRQLGEYLTNQINAIEGNEEDYANAWADLASTSESEFLKYFGKLDKDIQQNVVNKMYDLGYDISDELQKGINSINPKIKFGMDTSAIKTALQKLKKTNPGINTWFQMAGTSIDTVIGKLAVGGMPKVGQLFIANEKGPELIGNIGGQSFVANQNQMMDLLDKKIGNAQKSTGTQVINLYLDADHKIGSYTMEQLQNMAKTDGKPITIG